MTMFDFFGMQDPERWKKLFENLTRSGIGIGDTSLYRPGATVQGTGSPSLHASGRAADINPRENPVGSRWQFQPAPAGTLLPEMGGDTAQDLPGQRQIPGPLARWAAKQSGMDWGGDWSHTGTTPGADPMHFQFKRSDPQMAQDFSRRVQVAGGPVAPPSAAPVAPLGVPISPQDFEERRRRLYQREQTGPSIATSIAGPKAGGWLENLVQRNPAFMAGIWGIGGKPEVGLGITNAYGAERQREFDRAAKAEDVELDWRKYGLSKSAEDRTAADWNRVEKTRAERKAIWDQAAIDPTHQLWKGLTPDEREAALGLGADDGFKAVAEMRFKTATERAKFAEEMKRKQEMLRLWQQANQAPPAGALPTAGPAMGPAGAPSLGGPAATGAQGAPAAGAGGVTPPPALAPPITSPGAPAPQQGGLPINPLPNAVSGMPGGGAGGFQADPGTNAAIAANIFLNKEAADAVEKQAAAERAVRLAGPTKYLETEATERAKHRVGEEKKVQGAVEMWQNLDSFERSAKALGRNRLNSAASPSLDTWMGENVWRLGNDQAWNDRQVLMAEVDQIIVQARETQRGLGPLTEGEQAVLERAYAGMKRATTADAIYKHVDTVRGILARKIPGQKFEPRWIKAAEEAEKDLREKAKAKPMTPPGQAEGAYQADKITDDMEGARIYDHDTGKHGTVINGKIVPDKTQEQELRDIANQKFRRRKREEPYDYRAY